jgi:ADP-ribose pyrophosphatase YjhB (NUDIX family)
MSPQTSFLMSEHCWREVTRKMPIPCVDTIVWKKHTFLMGWRTIQPYKNVWALPGGRIVRGESFAETAIRQCRESGLRVDRPHFVGVYPVRFPSRHDITICMAAQWKSGNPIPTTELSRYAWFEVNRINNINTVGGNYKKMLRDWSKHLD